MSSNVDHTMYYEALIDTFATVGWNAIMDDMKAGADQLTLENCKTAEEFWLAKGQMEAYRKMLNYEDFIRQGFENYAEDL